MKTHKLITILSLMIVGGTAQAASIPANYQLECLDKSFFYNSILAKASGSNLDLRLNGRIQGVAENIVNLNLSQDHFLSNSTLSLSVDIKECEQSETDPVLFECQASHVDARLQGVIIDSTNPFMHTPVDKSTVLTDVRVLMRKTTLTTLNEESTGYSLLILDQLKSELLKHHYYLEMSGGLIGECKTTL